MRKSWLVLTLLLLTGAACFVVPAATARPLDDFINWGLAATVMVVLAVAAFFFEFEARAAGSKEIALVAMLGTTSAVLRVPFALLPGIQPCTYLIICSGYVFGPIAGFMVGAVTALVSNFFLGQGPWTPYQMFAWGLAGVAAAAMGRFKLHILWLIPFGILWGYLYGAIMNTWYWTAFIYPLTARTFAVAELNTVWFDTFHALGNALFLALFGSRTVAILQRFKSRFIWSYSGEQDLSPS